MDIKNYLKTSIPEFQQDQLYLESYLDAAGNFFEDIKEAIEHFDFSHDYKRGEFYNIENSLRDRGIRLPVGLPEDTRRRMLRDLAEILIKNGTEDGLVHAFRLIGFNAEILEGWAIRPDSLRRGFYDSAIDGNYDQIETPLIGSGEALVGNQVPLIGNDFYSNNGSSTLERYDLNTLVYTRLLYGNESVTDDGVFFEGYKYQDRYKRNLITDLPIVGEYYKEIPSKSAYVSKTPYHVVRFGEDGFNISVASYVDPDTGIEYAYSIDEGYRLVTSLIEYFTRKVFRPTTVRSIIIVALQEIIEEITITDEYEEVFNEDDVSSTEDQLIEDILDMQGCLDVAPVIGTPLLIGKESPFASQFSIIEPPRIGVDPDLLYWNIGSYSPYIGDYDIVIGTESIQLPVGDENPNNSVSNVSVEKCEIYDATEFDTSYDISVNDSAWYVGSVVPNIGEQSPDVGDIGNGEYPAIPLWGRTNIAFTNNTGIRVFLRGVNKDINGVFDTEHLVTVENGDSLDATIPPEYHFAHIISEEYTATKLNVSLNYQ